MQQAGINLPGVVAEQLGSDFVVEAAGLGRRIDMEQRKSENQQQGQAAEQGAPSPSIPGKGQGVPADQQGQGGGDVHLFGHCQPQIGQQEQGIMQAARLPPSFPALPVAGGQ